MSNNSVVLSLNIVRTALHKGTKSIDAVLSMEDVKVHVLEETVAAGASAQPVSLGSMTSAKGLVVWTPKIVGVRLNTNIATPTYSGSIVIALDTTVTALFLDTLETTPFDVEIWLIA